MTTLVTAKEAALKLNIPYRRVYGLFWTGALGGMKHANGRIRIFQSSIERYLFRTAQEKGRTA
jgi:hypothetical protein